MRLVSASALTRAKRCPTSYALPTISETSEAAEQGSENHARIEKQLREYRRTLDASKLEPELAAVLDGAQVHAIEMALVLDVYTGKVRELGEDRGRDYGTVDPAREVPMTLDAVFRKDGRIIVIDWKSRNRVTPAERNDQIRAQAAAVVGWLVVDEVEAGLCYLDNWEQDMAHFDAFEVDAILTEYQGALAHVQAATPDSPVALGPWCEYCPAQTACPGRRDMVMHIGRLVREQNLEDTLDDLTDETAGVFYGRIQALIKDAERAAGILRDRARRTPLPLPNGKVLAAIESERNSVDTKKAEQMLTAAGLAVPMKTTTYTQVREMNPRKTA